MKKLLLIIFTLVTGICYGAMPYTCYESSTRITPTITKVLVGFSDQPYTQQFIRFYDNKNRVSENDMVCHQGKGFIMCRLVDDSGVLYLQTQNYIITSKNKTIQIRFEGKPDIVQMDYGYTLAAVAADKTSQFNKKIFTLHLTDKCKGIFPQ